MGTAISCTECSQVAGLIQKLVETPRSSNAPSLRVVVLHAAVFHSKILCSDRDRHVYVLSVHKCAHAHAHCMQVHEL